EPGNLTAYWPVGPSFVYSVCFRIMPDSYALTTAVHIVCGLMVVLFSMLLAERWFNRAAALVTGLLLACWPVLIQFTTILGSELMFAALLTASLWVWTCKERPWLARAI